MSSTTVFPADSPFALQLRALPIHDPSFATQFVETLLQGACAAHVSDLHLQPNEKGLEISWRLDGVLQSLGYFPRGQNSDVVARLKVLADLLTYRTDLPQEGRLRQPHNGMEMRVSTFPTLHGERAVVRIFTSARQLLRIDDLSFPPDITNALRRVLQETSGVLIVSGPAGSGKTTTLYACLREIVQAAAGGASILSVEDPIEVAVPGVSQSQINLAAGFDLPTALRSVLRQDPEVVMVGEIRDRAVAEGVLGAALTGHLVLTTFHAGSAATAVSRLADMGLEPYLLRSGLIAVLQQRLVRRLCECASVSTTESDRLGLAVSQVKLPVGCPQCLHTGYRGRIVLAEMLLTQSEPTSRAILAQLDASVLEQAAVEAGFITRWERAHAAVEAGLTSAIEVRRVLGWSGGR